VLVSRNLQLLYSSWGSTDFESDENLCLTGCLPVGSLELRLAGPVGFVVALVRAVFAPDLACFELFSTRFQGAEARDWVGVETGLGAETRILPARVDGACLGRVPPRERGLAAFNRTDPPRAEVVRCGTF
jgi:hypothetical protein